MSLAQYVRRGFFELVLVVALVLPMLLVLDWLVEKKSKMFRALIATQVTLVLVIACSTRATFLI